MKKFKNKLKDNFLKTRPTESLDNDNDTLTKRMKFNFSYLDCDQPGCDKISDWKDIQLHKLFEKLKEYSRENIGHWEHEPIGGGNKRRCIYENYIIFPTHSELKQPNYVPHQVQWGRFRLEAKMRLAGFVVPIEYHDEIHKKTGLRFDKNTFYVVFLDSKHKFYPVEPK